MFSLSPSLGQTGNGTTYIVQEAYPLSALYVRSLGQDANVCFPSTLVIPVRRSIIVLLVQCIVDCRQQAVRTLLLLYKHFKQY